MKPLRQIGTLLSFVLLFISPLKAEIISDSLIEALAIVEDGYSRTDLYIEISKSFKTTNIDSALFYADQARRSAISSGDDKGIAESLFILGKINLRQDSIWQARDNFYLALKTTRDCKCDSLKAVIYMFLGKSFVFQDNYSEAISNFLKSLEIAERIDSKPILSDLLDDIGMVMVFLEDYDQAMVYFERALVVNKVLDDKQHYATTLRDIGFIYQNRKQYLQAEKQFAEALKIYTGLNYLPGISTSNLGIGNIEFAKGKYELALKYYNNALLYAKKIDISSKVSGPYIMAFSYNRLGATYIELKQYSNAIDALRKSSDLSEKYGMPGRMADAAFFFSEVYNKLGNTVLSYEYFKTYNRLSDSIINARNVSYITKLQMEYEYLKEEKERELQQIKTEASYKRKMLLLQLLAGVALIIIILFIIIFILYRKNERSKIRQAELRQQNLELEKENLQKELNYKTRELTTNVMYQLKKNNFIWNVSEKLKILTHNLKPENKVTVSEIIKEMESVMSKESWEEFEARFNEVHSDFYDKLIKDFPDLTPNELKLSAFLRLNMTTKDIATITYQTNHSITVARHRLRVKLGLERDDNLVAFLMKY